DVIFGFDHLGGAIGIGVGGVIDLAVVVGVLGTQTSLVDVVLAIAIAVLVEIVRQGVAVGVDWGRVGGVAKGGLAIGAVDDAIAIGVGAVGHAILVGVDNAW